MKTVTIICKYCQKEATIKKSKSKPNKYCSKTCAKNSRYDIHKEKIAKGIKSGTLFGKPTIMYFYNRYKKGAEKRNKVFFLTISQFESFWKKPCHYCNTQIHTIGIDRLNNTLGYTPKNTVPCCPTCNLMKRGMPYKQFIEHCLSIATHNK